MKGGIISKGRKGEKKEWGKVEREKGEERRRKSSGGDRVLREGEGKRDSYC